MPGLLIEDVMASGSAMKKNKKSADKNDDELKNKKAAKAEKKAAASCDSESDSESEARMKKTKKKEVKGAKKGTASSDSGSDSDSDEVSARQAKMEKKAKKEDKKPKEPQRQSPRLKPMTPPELPKFVDKKRAANSDSESDEESAPVQVKKQKTSEGDGKPVRLSVAEFRKHHSIAVTGGADACPDPFQTFEDSGYMPELLKAVKNEGFTAPSSIQSQCWPIAGQGKDLIAVAKTGSGKTCGFLFPAFHMIHKMGKLQCKRGDGPIAGTSAN